MGPTLQRPVTSLHATPIVSTPLEKVTSVAGVVIKYPSSTKTLLHQRES